LDIDSWLRGIGLAQYAEMFRANDIDIELLGRLTNDDLKDIGVVSFGHRKKLLEAIAELAGAVPVSPQPELIEPLASSAADRDAAEAAFGEAIEVSRGQQARLLELRAATSMTRLWRDQGKREEARDLLAPIYGWFTEGFETRDLKEAKGLFDELQA
jgi:hypothetical protein